MTAGRPPKPTEQKRRLGNPGKRALPDVATVTALPALPDDAPPHLESAGAALWDSVLATTKAWLAKSDHQMLTLLCELADRRTMLVESLATHGALIMRPDGHMVGNPSLTALATTEKQMVHIASLLGLTPSDRTRIGLGEVKAANQFEGMLLKRHQRGGDSNG
jgi:P27 family predicted phage terminase small subunit